GKAKGYASDALTAANEHTNTEIATLDGKAKGYASDALTAANEHTERRAVVAENNAVTRSNAYTDESSFRTLERANTYTNHRAAQAENNAVARSNAYTNKRFGELKNQVDRNEKRANGGIAGAMAMSTITGSGSGFGMALSGYRDQSAIAAGIQKSITPNTTVNVKVAWDSGNGVGAAAGFFTSW
ncbi:YadA-like family protein, partial [Salmonella enterica]|nr:YadA-like family protein [Salmonella enterica]